MNADVRRSIEKICIGVYRRSSAVKRFLPC
jgi:hypothetical protein